MAWTKAKTAIVASVVVLLAAGTATTVAVKEIQHRRMFAWQVPKLDPANFGVVLASAPPQVQIVPSKFSKYGGLMGQQNGYIDPTTGTAVGNTNEWLHIGICVPVDQIVRAAYQTEPLRTVFSTEIPKGSYDFISDLPNGSPKALQEEVKKKFNLVGKTQMRETDVLLLKLANSAAQGFKPANSLKRSMNLSDSTDQISKNGTTTWFNQSLDQSRLRNSLESQFQLPIIDETGLTNRYDFSFAWPVQRTPDNEVHNQATKGALFNQLGLELVPSREPIEMLVVEKAK